MSILRHLSKQEAEKHKNLLKKIEEMGQAPCKDYADDFFFDDGISITSRATQQIAKSICQECPAKQQCLEYAVVANIQYGIWGGLTIEERIELRKAMRKNPKQATA